MISIRIQQVVGALLAVLGLVAFFSNLFFLNDELAFNRPGQPDPASGFVIAHPYNTSVSYITSSDQMLNTITGTILPMLGMVGGLMVASAGIREKNNRRP